MNVKPAIKFLTQDGQAPYTEQVTTILKKLTANASYPDPEPALPVVQTAFDSFKTATADAVQGGKQSTVLRNARRKTLTGLLRLLANYVSSTANGDMEKLLGSGFPVQKQGGTPVGPMPAPLPPKITQGMLSGTINVSTSPVYGASAYNWSVALESAPDVDVQTALTTGARAFFAGLPIGKTYLVSLNAVGAAGTGDWSDYGSLMVI